MRSGRINVRPWCPFCDQEVGRLQMREVRKLGEFPVGRCDCGAVYTCDATGHNVGAALVEALVYACNDNWDLAWDLLPENDYLTDRIELYDEQTHQVVDTGNLDGRAVRGVIYFVRLQREIADLIGNEPPLRPRVSATLPVEPERDPARQKQRASKAIVAGLVEAGDVDGLVDLCFDDKRTLRFMHRLLYDPDEAKRWRTAALIGTVAARFSTRKPGAVSDLLHRLFDACADSASANWGAVETIGAIIAARPDLFGSFALHLLGFAGDPAMRLQVLWALGSIAATRPETIRAIPFYGLIDLLHSPDAGWRGHMVRLLGRLRAQEVAGQIDLMRQDAAELVVYEDGLPEHTTVGRLAEKALAMIHQQGEQNSDSEDATAAIG